MAVISSIVLTVGGCSVAENGQTAWVRQNGGELADDARQLRVDRLAEPLLAQCAGQSMTVRVLNMGPIAAYGWPNGRIFVSRGLMDGMNDDEVRAALAHELGHLLSAGQLRSMVGLKGGQPPDGNLDCESRADRIGVRLLIASHIPPGAMTSMLRKVSGSPEISQYCRQSLVHRMEVLRVGSN